MVSREDGVAVAAMYSLGTTVDDLDRFEVGVVAAVGISRTRHIIPYIRLISSVNSPSWFADDAPKSPHPGASDASIPIRCAILSRADVSALIDESISRRVKVYGEVIDVRAEDALGKGRNRAERDGKWNDCSEARENDWGSIAL